MEKTGVRGEQEALGPCPGLLRVPFICVTNTCGVLEPAHPAAESPNSDGLEQTRSCYSPTSSPQKHSQGWSEFIGGHESQKKVPGFWCLSGSISPLSKMQREALGHQSPMGSHRALVRAARSPSSGSGPWAL